MINSTFGYMFMTRFLTVVALLSFFFFQAEDGIRDDLVTGVQTCALPIWRPLLQRAGGGAPAGRAEGGGARRSPPPGGPPAPGAVHLVPRRRRTTGAAHRRDRKSVV